jgi:hypothetical protein
MGRKGTPEEPETSPGMGAAITWTTWRRMNPAKLHIPSDSRKRVRRSRSKKNPTSPLQYSSPPSPMTMNSSRRNLSQVPFRGGFPCGFPFGWPGIRVSAP